MFYVVVHTFRRKQKSDHSNQRKLIQAVVLIWTQTFSSARRV